MKWMKRETTIQILYYLFFINGLVEIVSEYFQVIPVIVVTKPLVPILLIILYTLVSQVRNKLFYGVLLTSLITNILFIPQNETILFYGVVVFTIHRILILILIYKLIKITKFWVFLAVSILLFAIFLYLFVESSYVPVNSYNLLVFHVFLISILGGLCIANYVVNDSIESSFLLIAGLLFMCLQLVIFVEKYFLYAIDVVPFRPIAMLLNVLGFFCFYKYIVTAEKSKQ